MEVHLPCRWRQDTSRWPLKAAWCSAVRPARSDTFTLLSRGTRASAQRTALFAAAMWSGVCQFLSLAFTSAECFSNTWTASCKHIQMHLDTANPGIARRREPPRKRQRALTSLQEATARCRGVSHLLSLAFTLAPTNETTTYVLEKDKNNFSRVLFFHSSEFLLETTMVYGCLV